MTDQPLAIGSKLRTQAILNAYGLQAKKKFGQNFLIDLDILTDITQVADLSADDIVIEIGPGIGGLTEQLAKRAKHVVAFEIDQQMVEILEDTLSPYDNVTVIEGDVLKVDVAELISQQFGENTPVKIVANLPYYITTPIVMMLLKSQLNWQNIVVMMQKEVGQRLDAKVGTKAYGALTLTVGYYAKAQIALSVPAQSFNPAPNVDSMVVKLSPKNQETIENTVFDLIKISFAHRRKSLLNNLQQGYGKEHKIQLQAALQQADIDEGIRSERLTMPDFVRLNQALHANQIKMN